MLSLPAARLAHPANAALLAVSEHKAPLWMEQSVCSERIAGGTGVVIAQAMEMQQLAQRREGCKRSVARLHQTGQRAAPSGCAAVAARRASATALTALNAEGQKAYASTAPFVLAPPLHPCTPPRRQQTPRGSPKAVPSSAVPSTWRLSTECWRLARCPPVSKAPIHRIPPSAILSPLPQAQSARRHFFFLPCK